MVYQTMRRMAPPPYAKKNAKPRLAWNPQGLTYSVESRVFAQAIHRRKADKSGGWITLGHRLVEPLECRIQVAETATDLHQKKRLDVLVLDSRRELIENLLSLRFRLPARTHLLPTPVTISPEGHGSYHRFHLKRSSHHWPAEISPALELKQ